MVGRPGALRIPKIWLIWRSSLNSRGLYLRAQMELEDVLGHLKSLNDMIIMSEKHVWVTRTNLTFSQIKRTFFRQICNTLGGGRYVF